MLTKMVSIFGQSVLLVALLEEHAVNPEEVFVAQQRPPSSWADYNNYCDFRYKCNNNDTEHIACAFKDRSHEIYREDTYECTIDTTMTEHQRGDYLIEANQFRNERNAANMKVLQWDYKLERFAKIAVTNPKYLADEIPSKESFWFPCASFENYERVIGLKSGKESEGSSNPFRLWKFYNATNMSTIEEYKPFPSNLPHEKYRNTWTALAWAETDRIGCAQMECKKHYGYDGYGLNQVCMLAVGGNEEGKPVYEEGKPCSKCPEGYDCVGKGNYVNNLCKVIGEPAPTRGPIADPTPAPTSATANGPSLLVVTSVLISQQLRT